MRVLLAVLLVASTASADQLLDVRGGGFTTLSPEELEGIDVANVKARRVELDAAIAAEKNPVRKAQLVLERADGAAARAVSERVHADRIMAALRAGPRGPGRMVVFRERSQRLNESRLAFREAIADYLDVYCAPQTGSRGTTCPKPRSWQVSDGVMWRLAFALRADGRLDDARHVWRRLVHEHPTSKYALDARLELGESEYMRGKMAAAIDELGIVERSKAPAKMRAFALYRHAWCELGLRRFDDAFLTFAKAIALEPANEQYRIDIINAADTTTPADDAYDKLDRVAPGHALDLASILAQRWGFNGSVDKSLRLHAELLRRAPTDRRACEWQHMVVVHLHAAVVSKSKANYDPVRLLAELERLVEIDRTTRAFDDDHSERCMAAARQMTISIVNQGATTIATEDVYWLSRRALAVFAWAYGEDPEMVAGLRRMLP